MNPQGTVLPIKVLWMVSVEEPLKTFLYQRGGKDPIRKLRLLQESIRNSLSAGVFRISGYNGDIKAIRTYT